MAKWSKNADQFKIKIAYDKHGRARATIPAPIIQGFDRPASMTLKLESGAVTVTFDGA